MKETSIWGGGGEFVIEHEIDIKGRVRLLGL
jgi:hypothetical protein